MQLVRGKLNIEHNFLREILLSECNAYYYAEFMILSFFSEEAATTIRNLIEKIKELEVSLPYMPSV